MTCPCCGYVTIEETWDICDICFWEHDPVQFEDPFYTGGANIISLYEAQHNFAKFGACDEASIRSVRPPSAHDIRDEQFVILHLHGLTFTIPNRYGQYFADILSCIDVAQYAWHKGGEEAYHIENNELGAPLFPKTAVLDGPELFTAITTGEHYIIFADLKAFPERADVCEIETYEQFVASSCQFVLLVVDCSDVTVYAKSSDVLIALLRQIKCSRFKNVTHIDAADPSTSLIAF